MKPHRLSKDCDKRDHLPAGAKVVYTYDVHWVASEVSWASRWDAYLKMPGGRVHWFSILNSLMVVLVMSSIVAMIMMRTIRRDLARYEGLLGDTGAPVLGTSACTVLPAPHVSLTCLGLAAFSSTVASAFQSGCLSAYKLASAQSAVQLCALLLGACCARISAPACCRPQG